MTDTDHPNVNETNTAPDKVSGYKQAFTPEGLNRIAKANTKTGFYTALRKYRNGEPFTGPIEETRAAIAKQTGWDKLIEAKGPLSLRAMRASRAAAVADLAWYKVELADQTGELKLITPDLLKEVRLSDKHASDMQDALEDAQRLYDENIIDIGAVLGD